ncbi:MAG TPA: hypothetical protein VK629_12550 [Steroidobacteraceae bacterium]|nr:hypothetical protein [Steroidobacteraceae bacterium]
MHSFVGVLALALAGCGQGGAEKTQTENDEPANSEKAATTAAPVLPAPVNGWIEYPLPEGVIRIQAAQWRTDTVEIPVKANGELEYKLSMKKGDALVYSIDYGKLEHVGVMVSEFHGHTPKREDGVGDLMFYSKTGGATQHGQFTSPWDGIHGWYLKNDSAKDAAVTLKLAGFYELMDQ